MKLLFGGQSGAALQRRVGPPGPASWHAAPLPAVRANAGEKGGRWSVRAALEGRPTCHC